MNLDVCWTLGTLIQEPYSASTAVTWDWNHRKPAASVFCFTIDRLCGGNRLSHLELGQPFDGLQRSQDSQNPEGLDGVDVLAFGPSVQPERIEDIQWVHVIIIIIIITVTLSSKVYSCSTLTCDMDVLCKSNRIFFSSFLLVLFLPYCHSVNLSVVSLRAASVADQCGSVKTNPYCTVC